MRNDRTTTRRFTVALAVCAFAAVEAGGEPDEPPDFIDLTGTVRDFRERTVEGGHTDFERQPQHGFGLYVGNIAYELGSDRLPVFTGEGGKVSREWRDSEGRPICWTLYDAGRGDTEGAISVSDTGGIESAVSFDQWYREVLGLNQAAPLTLRLVRQPNGTYVFDDREDPEYEHLGGFFPIEDDLFGNSDGVPDRNFHFTFELHTTFTYDASAQQVFQFVGDDDVWVFVDNRLVIDLGGVHSAREQFVDLDRLNLVDGRSYTLEFFFAERHRTQSNFRIVTNLLLENADTPQLTAVFD